MKKLITKRRLMWAGIIAGLVLIGLVIAAYRLAGRVEPFLREQTIAYLKEKYKADVEIGRFHVSVPMQDPLAVLLAAGRGAHLQVGVDQIVMRRRSDSAYPPFMTIQKLAFRVHLPSRWQPPFEVDHLRITGLEIHIPPKGERAPLLPKDGAKPAKAAQDQEEKPPAAIINVVDADGAVLVVHPKDPGKEPLRFDMPKLQLRSAGPGVPMRYETVLQNPKPPGTVYCKGSFGPFNVDSPGDSPLTGDYTFTNANLGVFKGIAGILDSKGRFKGVLNTLEVDGEANVPDFRLNSSGNQVPLKTRFHAIVDGTNGNTLLQPVQARLGSTDFVVRGGVVRNKGENGKTVALDVVCNRGDLSDFLRLVLKGNTQPLVGGIGMRIKLEVPPGKADYADRLIVSGNFGLTKARFTSPQTQDKIDDLSRRAQGKPRNDQIDNVPSDFAGTLHLRNALLRLKDLTFEVSGADVLLNGTYNLHNDELDFHGQARTRARVSQMVKSRWKGLLLKPVDPFFAKDGAGAVFNVAITGTRQKPDFGLERGKKDADKAKDKKRIEQARRDRSR